MQLRYRSQQFHSTQGVRQTSAASIDVLQGHARVRIESKLPEHTQRIIAFRGGSNSY